MRNLIQKRKSEGFTIIEVMIVLAIAALILLIVLLAVPALQRNSRNTSIKSDVGTVAGGINTYESDNNGTLPTFEDGTGLITIAKPDATDPNKETVNVNGSTVVKNVAAAPTDNKTGVVSVRTGFDCTNNTASTRAASLYYYIETSSGVKLQCSST